jgi:hypothetical protein
MGWDILSYGGHLVTECDGRTDGRGIKIGKNVIVVYGVPLKLNRHSKVKRFQMNCKKRIS